MATAHEQSSKKIVSNENAKSRVEIQAAKDRKKSLEVSAGTGDKSIGKAQDDLAESTNKASAILQRQADILAFVTQGFSKGQSSVLAYAKAAGATEQMIKSLGDTLQSTRSLIGGDPFDKSLGGLKALRNEYSVARSVIKSYNNEQGLTRKQAEALARDKLRLLEQYKAEVITFQQLKDSLRSLNLETVSLAAAANKATTGLKDQEKGVKTASAALQRMTNDLDRVNQANRFVNEGLDHASSVSLANFQRNLAKTGLSLDVQKRKLEEYKQGLTGFNKNTTASGRSRDGYIGAAIAPQITDIVTSLQGGQNPLTVILAQGGQLRDLFQQMGVAGEDMAMRIRNAIMQMPASIAAVAGAMARVTVELPFMLAKGFARMTMDFLRLNAAFDGLIAFGPALESALNGVGVRSKVLSGIIFGLEKTLLAARAATMAFIGSVAAVLVVALGAAAIEAFKVMKATTELNRAVLTSGASIGFTEEQYLSLAVSMRNTANMSSTIIRAFSEIASQGVFTGQQLEGLTRVALDMEKYMGVAISETAKSFADLAKDPVDVLYKLAIQNGLVRTETINAVQELLKQGKVVEANALAVETYRLALVEMTKEAKNRLSPLEKLWVVVKDSAVLAINTLIDAGNKATSFSVDVSKSYFDNLLGYLQSKVNKDGFFYYKLDVDKNYTGNLTAYLEELKGKIQSALSGALPAALRKGVEESKFAGSSLGAELGIPDVFPIEIKFSVKQEELEQLGTKVSDSVNKAVNFRAFDRSGTKDIDAAALAQRNSTVAKEEEYWFKRQKDSLEGIPALIKELTETTDRYRNSVGMTSKALEFYAKTIDAIKKKLAEAVYDRDAARTALAFDINDDKFNEIKRRAEIELSLNDKLEKDKLDLLKSAYEQDKTNYAEYSTAKTSLIQAEAEKEIALAIKTRTALVEEKNKELKQIQARYNEQTSNLDAAISNGAFKGDSLKQAQEYDKYWKEFIAANRKAGIEAETIWQEYTSKIEASQSRVKAAISEPLNEYGKAVKAAQTALTEYNLEEQERIRIASEATARQLQLTFATEREAAVLNAVNKARDEYNSEIKKQVVELEKLQKAYENEVALGDGGINPQQEATYKAFLLAKEKLDKIYLDRKSAAERSAIDAVLLYEAQERNKMLDSITSVLVTALTKGGKEGAKSLRAWLEQELSKELTISIKAEVTKLLGADGKGGIRGLLESILGKVSSLDRDQEGNITGEAGKGLLGKLGDLFPSLKGVLEAIPGAISDGFQGAEIGAAISNGFEIFKGSGKALGAIGAIIGSFIPIIGPFLGAAIGGLINRAFGRKLENTGIQGTARGTGSVEAQKFEFFKGGWFRSDKTNLSTVDAETQKALEDTIGAITNKLKEYSKILGVSSEALANFSYQFKIDTKDLSADQIQKKFQDMFSDFTAKAAGSIFQNTEFQEYAAKAKGSVDDILKYLGDLAAAYSTLKNQGALIQDVIGEMLSIKDLESLKNEGEGLTGTLQRLLGVFIVTNLIATTLGKDATTAFGAVGKASYAARESLVALAGSVEQLGSSVNFFLDNFYSQAEKDAFLKTQAQNTLSTGFAGLARAIPGTRAEFRALVEGVDLTTEEGRKLYVELLRLAPAMFEVTKGVAAAVQSINGLAGLTSNAISSLFEQVLATATSRQEAETLAAGKAEGLFYDSLMQSIIGAATDAIMTAVIEPMSSSLLISSSNAGQSLTVGASAAGSALTAGGFSASAALVGVVALVKNITSIMRSPEYISAMQEFILTIRTVSGELYDSGVLFKDAASSIQEAAPRNSISVGEVLEMIDSFVIGQRDYLQKAYDILKKAVDVDKKVIEARLKSLEALSEINKAAVESLLLAGETSKGAVYEVARTELEQAFASIRQGLLPDVDKYQANLNRVMEDLNSRTYASKFEEDKARLSLAAELTSIEGFLTPQKTVAEQQLATLNALLTNAESQLALLGANAEADYSVAQAVANWNRVVESTLAGWAWLESQYWWATPDAPNLRPLMAPAAPLPLPQVAPVGDWGYGGGGGGGDTGLVDAMAVLTSEVQMLRAEVRADVEVNTKTSQILSRVSQDGETLSVAPSY